MKISIKAKPGAKREEIVKIDETHYAVSVKERPVEDKANKAVVKALAKHFKVGVSRVKILSGKTSKQKIAEIS